MELHPPKRLNCSSRSSPSVNVNNNNLNVKTYSEVRPLTIEYGSNSKDKKYLTLWDKN